MYKGVFIKKVKELLGENIDPLVLKEKLENTANDDERIGHMTYEDAYLFIQGFQQSQKSLGDLREHLPKDEYIGITTANNPLVSGIISERQSRDSRGGFSRPVEKHIIDNERE